MADTSAPIASAVIVPSPPRPTSPSSKRRLSSPTDSSTKRPRLSSSPSHTTKAQSPSSQPSSTRQDASARRPSQPEVSQDRRKASIQEERKRGQRLFGGLLSTLSRTEPNSQSKRRQEVEKRQIEREKARKEGDEERKRERLAKLKSVRVVEQVKWEEQAMKTKHANLKAMANSLSTKTSPKVYYKPWELLPEQEDCIKQQVADTAAQIEHERRAFYNEHPHLRPKDEPSTENRDDTADSQLVGNTNNEPSLTSTDNANTTNYPSVTTSSPSKERSASAQHDEQHGDILVENDEDAVIY